MGQKKHCFCCDESQTADNKIEGHTCGINNVCVKLIRIEDDTKLLTTIANDLKTDVDFTSLKQHRATSVERDTHLRRYAKVETNKHSLKQPSLKKYSAISGKRVVKKQLRVAVSTERRNRIENGSLQRKKNLQSVGKSKKSTSKLKKVSFVTIENGSLLEGAQEERTSISQDSILEENESDLPRTTSPADLEVRNNSQKERLIKLKHLNTDSVTSADYSVVSENATNGCCDIENSEKPVSLNNVSISTDESVLQFESTMMSPSPDGALTENTEMDSAEDLPERRNVKKSKSSQEVSNSKNSNSLTKEKHSKKDVCESKQLETTEVRTMYDLMNDISAIMPSWNLHILPDTNTFCICQVNRDDSGVPYLSKCIELDDDFNAKVYIYRRYNQKLDGTYDSEKKVAELIDKVDKMS